MKKLDLRALGVHTLEYLDLTAVNRQCRHRVDCICRMPSQVLDPVNAVIRYASEIRICGDC